MSRYTLTPQAHEAKIKRWAAQKGAQHQDTFGRGYVWYADAILYHFWYHSEAACEALLAEMILEMKAEIATEKERIKTALKAG